MACSSEMKCDYPLLNCDCGGKEGEPTWHCKEPPKPPAMCPPMPPKDASPCTLKAGEPPPPPCHYEMAAVDCACAASKWACVAAPTM